MELGRSSDFRTVLGSEHCCGTHEPVHDLFYNENRCVTKTANVPFGMCFVNLSGFSSLRVMSTEHFCFVVVVVNDCSSCSVERERERRRTLRPSAKRYLVLLLIRPITAIVVWRRRPSPAFLSKIYPCRSQTTTSEFGSSPKKYLFFLRLLLLQITH